MASSVSNSASLMLSTLSHVSLFAPVGTHENVPITVTTRVMGHLRIKLQFE